MRRISMYTGETCFFSLPFPLALLLLFISGATRVKFTKSTSELKILEFWKLSVVFKNGMAGWLTDRNMKSLMSFGDLITKLSMIYFFRQITTFIKVCAAFVFGLQTLWLMDFTKIFRLKAKNKGCTNFYECCDLTKKVHTYLV